MSYQYDEGPEPSLMATWTILILLGLVLVGWGLFHYAIVPDAPRHWDHGALPDAPGESIYSTERVGTQSGAPLIAPLPDARPKERMKSPEEGTK